MIPACIVVARFIHALLIEIGKMGWGHSSVVEYSPSMHSAWGLISSPLKAKGNYLNTVNHFFQVVHIRLVDHAYIKVKSSVEQD